ncbi:MAG: heme-binding protein [Vicinamibacteria bacterium]
MIRAWLIVGLSLASLACSGSAALDAGGCAGNCATAADFLTIADVERVVSQGASDAQTRGAKATIAVVDRVGNVLAVFRMDGADPGFRISSGKGITGGLEDARLPTGPLPSSFAVIAKAITGAFLSSEGNAFSTRTASQIIQENFNPQERSQPSGPLYGVQFSQLACSDVINTTAMLGPRPSPLGLAADPGGLPLYKDGRLVGGVGVISDSLYSLDLDITNVDADQDELISVASASGFMAPEDRRGDRITADGRTFRFVDGNPTPLSSGSVPALRSIPGALTAVPGYFDGTVRAGTAFDTPSSGFRADADAFADVQGYVLVDAQNQNRFPPRAGPDGLMTAAEVRSILKNGMSIANRARAQIRRPLGLAAQVTVSVVDSNGVILGVVRSKDAPVFGTDVAVQKARTSAFFSRADAATLLRTIPSTSYAGSGTVSVPSNYLTALRTFLADPSALSNGVAYSVRAIGNLHRPFFPDGIEGSEPGPFSTPYANWSPLHVGLQLDLVNNALLGAAQGVGCAFLPQLINGIQIFPGGVPIYRGNQLVGAVGVSGDGVDQDDMVAFLGLTNAARELSTGLGNAPKALRADTIEPRGLGTRLRYVQCPQAPFIDSTEQNVCSGF